MEETDFSDSLVQSYLNGKEIAVLATVNSDGSPLATPMWFIHDGLGFGMVSVAADRKVKNLKRDPRVSVVIESGSGGDIECVIIQGSVEFMDTRPTANASVCGSSRNMALTWRRVGVVARFPTAAPSS